MSIDDSKIVISGADGGLCKDALHWVLLHMHFPDSPDERALAREILWFERVRYGRLGPEYRPTEIAQLIIKRQEKLLGQVHVAGLCGLAMVGQTLTSGSCSLNKASEIASEYAYQYPKATFSQAFNPQDKPIELSVRTDPTNIRTAWRKYRKSAHICIANIVAAEYGEIFHPFEEAREFEACFIQTCAFFQAHLTKQPDADKWGMFDLITTRPDEVAAFPILTPSDAAHVEFFSPYWKSKEATEGNPLDGTD